MIFILLQTNFLRLAVCRKRLYYHTYISVTPNIDFRTLLRTLGPSDAIFSWTQDAGSSEQDAGSSDARRGRCGRKTRALWTQDAGAVDARRGRCGRKTRAPWMQDAGRRSVKLFLGSTVTDFRIWLLKSWLAETYKRGNVSSEILS